MIPRNIYQTFHTKNIQTKFLMNSWKSKNKNFSHYFYNDHDAMIFMKSLSPDMYTTYVSLPKGALTSGLLAILYSV